MSAEKLAKLVKVLGQTGKATPNKIAKNISSDGRTTHKLLAAAKDLGLVQCKTVEVGGRKYSECSLTPEFSKLQKTKAKP